MSKVSIKVGPKTYTVVTAEGEEAKIAALGEIIDAKYQLLGRARAVQETDNLILASLFLADELDENRKLAEAASERIEAAQREAETARAEAASIRAEMDKRIESAVAQARKDSEEALRLANETAEKDRASAGDKTSELRAEIEALRKAGTRAQEDNAKLKAELAELREASRQQHDLFGGDEPDEAVIERLEALAARVEQTAAALEGTGRDGDALEGGSGAD